MILKVHIHTCFEFLAVPTPVKNNQQPVIISVTIILVTVTVVTIVLIIMFFTRCCQTNLTQKHRDEDKEKLYSAKNEQYGLIEVDEDMFAAHGPDRFVPTIVRKYEGMATDEQVDKTPDLEEPQKNANVKSTTVASLMEKFQNLKEPQKNVTINGPTMVMNSNAMGMATQFSKELERLQKKIKSTKLTPLLEQFKANLKNIPRLKT